MGGLEGAHRALVEAVGCGLVRLGGSVLLVRLEVQGRRWWPGLSLRVEGLGRGGRWVVSGSGGLLLFLRRRRDRPDRLGCLGV